MNTANGATVYQQADLKREAMAILKTEKCMNGLQGPIKNISWSIRICKANTALLAQGFINHQLISATLVL